MGGGLMVPENGILKCRRWFSSRLLIWLWKIGFLKCFKCLTLVIDTDLEWYHFLVTLYLIANVIS